jgi:prophage regulatory protein
MSIPSIGLGKRIGRLPDVIAKTGMSRSTILRKEAAGEFPKKIHVSANIVGWDLGEVDDWIAGRAADREVAA